MEGREDVPLPGQLPLSFHFASSTYIAENIMFVRAVVLEGRSLSCESCD
jgi:hypothetical protein